MPGIVSDGRILTAVPSCGAEFRALGHLHRPRLQKANLRPLSGDNLFDRSIALLHKSESAAEDLSRKLLIIQPQQVNNCRV
jgi:hypothetical protein